MDRRPTDLTQNGGREHAFTSHASPTKGVLLINLGTPDRCEVPAIRRYLTEFLSDPAVIRLPKGLGWLNQPLARTIAQFRAPGTTEMYERIWTDKGSPLRTITAEQAVALEQALPRGWRVFYAMRYGRPSIHDTLKRIQSEGIGELVVVPMYPQYSEPTTGTAMRQLFKFIERVGRSMHVTTRTVWYDDHGYINAQAGLLRQYADEKGLTPDDTYLVFSTHGLPVSYVKRGDPYPQQIDRTVALVGKALGWPKDRMVLAYQSRFGPVEWLKPYTDDTLRALAEAGETRVLVCPLSFTADCLETLEEIDLRYRELVESAGAELYLCPALNTFAPFVSALKHLVLRGPRPVSDDGLEVDAGRLSQALPASQDGDIGALVMVGMSTPGRLGRGQGPHLAYTDESGLRSVKRSQCEVPALLRGIHDHGELREAWLWNTCHRFELYGWLDKSNGYPGDSAAVGRIRQRLFDGVPPRGTDINVLFGADAWRHLLRTAVGLNSDLPGERDVLGQLHAAHRLADRAGTAGGLTERLVRKVVTLERELRSHTGWGRFAPDYTFVALSELVRTEEVDLTQSRIVVVGGSTTSASVLETLRERFDVPDCNLTLLYRGHKKGGHLKLLRRAIGGGRRIRVQSYEEPSVIRRFLGADVVVFGVDTTTPVLDAERLTLAIKATAGRSGQSQCTSESPTSNAEGPRWKQVGPFTFDRQTLTIFDFNLFGSTAGLDSLPGVRLFDARRLEAEVNAYAERMCAAPDFHRAVEAAEAAIRLYCSEPTRIESRAISPCRSKPATPLTGSNDKPAMETLSDGEAMETVSHGMDGNGRRYLPPLLTVAEGRLAS